MGSRLPLRSYRDIPAFLLWTLRIRRQLAGTAGVVGYALDAHLLRKTFWTVSAWTGAEGGRGVRPPGSACRRSGRHPAAHAPVDVRLLDGARHSPAPRLGRDPQAPR
jgi:hypothetical protein